MTDQSVRMDTMDTRTKILLAARDVFGKKGFYETKMEDVAREAGIAKGTLYLYFPSKEVLYQCLLKEGFRYFVQKLVEVVKSAQDFDSKIRGIIKSMIEVLEENKEFIFRIMYELPLAQIWNEKIKEKFTEEQKEINSILKEILADAMKEGIIHKGNLDVVSNSLIGLIMRPIMSNFLEKKSFDGLEEELFTLARRAFYVNP